ncbi:fungal-specific transcription factor domain-containing protein [Aspergillus egyptiacus]|nr:fungal-specific transcription factor domain-containing protein [Aspergillus egyptiacus]
MSTQDRKGSHLSTRSRRAARACARCHSRKVRCDGSITGFPCTNCRLDGRSCTLHSGKRDQEKQLLRAIAKEREGSYATRRATSEVPDPVKVTFIRSQGQLRVPIQDVLDVFTKHYFLYVHPCLPVIDEAVFWRKYRCVDGSAGKISTLLFQAMLFAASSFVPLEAAKECGYSSLLSARDDLYRRAKHLYENGIEKDRLVIAQASLLLTYYTTDAERSTNSRWLRIAIRHAKKERAHLYYRLPSLNGRSTSDLKRLWWCCIIRDRIISLGMRRPIQITPDEFDLRQPGLSLQDLEEEVLHSEVYTPETKIALARVLASLCHLVTAVTGLIMLVYPVTQSMPLSLAERRAELDRLEETKFALLDWELNWVANPDGKEYYIHPSLTLYTNLCAIYFQSARIALCNRICLLVGLSSDLSDGTDLLRIESCRCELAEAIRSTADNVKQLILNGVADKLPISAVAYTLLPQILLSIQTQLSTTPEDKQIHEVMLVFFVEIFRCFRSQYYMQLILAVSWKALEFCRAHANTHPYTQHTLPSSPGTEPRTSNSSASRSSSVCESGEDLSKKTDKDLSAGTDVAITAFSHSYPVLFQLRLNEYIRLLRYIDEFMSLRRAPGEGALYSATVPIATPSEHPHQQQQPQQQTTNPSLQAFFQSSFPPDSLPECEISQRPGWAASMDNFVFAYFGESELDISVGTGTSTGTGTGPTETCSVSASISESTSSHAADSPNSRTGSDGFETEQRPNWEANMDKFVFAYFGESELDGYGQGEGEGCGGLREESVSASASTSASEHGTATEGKRASSLCSKDQDHDAVQDTHTDTDTDKMTARVRGADRSAPAAGKQDPVQHMLDCLPMLGA